MSLIFFGSDWIPKGLPYLSIIHEIRKRTFHTWQAVENRDKYNSRHLVLEDPCTKASTSSSSMIAGIPRTFSVFRRDFLIRSLGLICKILSSHQQRGGSTSSIIPPSGPTNLLTRENKTLPSLRLDVMSRRAKYKLCTLSSSLECQRANRPTLFSPRIRGGSQRVVVLRWFFCCYPNWDQKNAITANRSPISLRDCPQRRLEEVRRSSLTKD